MANSSHFGVTFPQLKSPPGREASAASASQSIGLAYIA